MTINKISHNTMLDNYVLNIELSKILSISSNAYRFWKDVKAVKYDGSRVVYLEINSIPKNHQDLVHKCTKLDGYVQAQAFCKYTGLAPSHLTKSNNSKIYKIFDILQVSSVKLVNLKKFYDDLGLDYNYQIYIEKCKYFGPSPLEKKIRLNGEMCLGYY
ncbi:MAG: cysteine permease [Campylobacteraceae bacterium]|nr:cysteine permease [Campylobacteraceae bacterium]